MFIVADDTAITTSSEIEGFGYDKFATVAFPELYKSNEDY
jgi:hypothetical protein